MADTAKYTPINGGTLVTDFKSHFSLMKTKRTIACAYVFVFFFIVFTIFLAFSPSANSSSPWFTNIFTTSISNSSKTAPDFSDESYRSHFPSVFSYFFPNSSSQVYARSPNNTISPITDKVVPYKANQSTPLAPTSFPNVNSSAPLKGSSEIDKGSSSLKNETQDKELFSKGDVLKSNQSSLGVTKSPESSTGEKNATASTETSKNGTNSRVLKKQGVAKPPESSSGEKNVTSYGVKSSPWSNSVVSGNQGLEDLVKSLINCNLYDGNWVRDESYPLYKPGSCSLIDEQFNCFLNGRPDHDYYKLKWKPKGCTLPRLNGTHMLELLRGKRLAFVGDSLNRNMWESLVCILKNSVKDQKKVYEESGKHIFRGEASYSFIFEEYKCRIEFFVSPFLVREWEIAEKNGAKKETLRLDLIGKASDKYKNADVLIFNTGHWWTHEKTSKGKDYYQEGSHVYNDLNVLEAFRKALTTWGRWVDANINPKKTHVMFRGYSATHFSGGQWNSGGQCDHETEPIKNDTYLTPYSSKMVVFEKVLTGMKTHVSYLNITRLTDYRKDGHPSAYRKLHMSKEEKTSPHMFQDCSHWCLPGVPDGWNELLYAELLLKQMQNH